MKGKKADKTKATGKVLVGVLLDPDMKRRVGVLAQRLERTRTWVCNDALRCYGPLKEIV